MNFPEQNMVLWFVNAVRELGGEYFPYRDFSNEKLKWHPTGRREFAAMVNYRRWYRV